MEPYLSLQAFELWRQEHDKKMDRLLSITEQHITTAADKNTHIEHRLTTLETHREHAVVGLGIFTAVVSAVVGGLTGWLAK